MVISWITLLWHFYLKTFPLQYNNGQQVDMRTTIPLLSNNNKMTTFTNNRNPDLSIRFTQPELCDPNVIQVYIYKKKGEVGATLINNKKQDI